MPIHVFFLHKNHLFDSQNLEALHTGLNFLIEIIIDNYYVFILFYIIYISILFGLSNGWQNINIHTYNIHCDDWFANDGLIC